MPNKVAVFFRGHKRIWDYIKDHTLPFYESLGDHVDYYVTFWNTDIDLAKLQNDFPQDRLKVFQPMSTSGPEYSPLHGPVYQTNFLMGKKYKEEVNSGKKYDLVLETRFDNCIFDFDKELYESEIDKYSHRLGVPLLDQDHLSDHLFLTNCNSLIVCNSRAMPCENIPDMFHKVFYDYAMMYNLDPYRIKWFRTVIARPSILKFDKENLIHSDVSNDAHFWNSGNYTLQEKFDFIKNMGCSVEEYTDHTSIYHLGN
jgi:hypothetical protein